MKNETKDKSTIPHTVWRGLEAKSYTVIAQELPSQDEELRRWIAIYAAYHLEFNDRAPWVRYYSFLENAKNSRFVAIEFTIAKNTLENPDGFDLSNATIAYYQTQETEEEINTFLARKQIDPQLFTPPWTCDYPYIKTTKNPPTISFQHQPARP